MASNVPVPEFIPLPIGTSATSWSQRDAQSICAQRILVEHLKKKAGM